MPSYADYCPIAVGVEIIGDRWTPLVLRELMIGSTGFNEIHRGVPKMSRTLLSSRLRMLERRGLVTRSTSGVGRAVDYRLTDAGAALQPVVWGLGHWAAEWVFGDPTDEELDARGLLWRLHTHALPERLPRARTVVHVVLTGVNGGQGWLDIKDRTVTVCTTDPGAGTDLVVEADSRQMHRWLLGMVPFRDMVSDEEARVIGPSRLAKTFPSWFDTATFVPALERGRRRRVAGEGQLREVDESVLI